MDFETKFTNLYDMCYALYQCDMRYIIPNLNSKPKTRKILYKVLYGDDEKNKYLPDLIVVRDYVENIKGDVDRELELYKLLLEIDIKKYGIEPFIIIDDNIHEVYWDMTSISMTIKNVFVSYHMNNQSFWTRTEEEKCDLFTKFIKEYFNFGNWFLFVSEK